MWFLFHAETILLNTYARPVHCLFPAFLQIRMISSSVVPMHSVGKDRIARCWAEAFVFLATLMSIIAITLRGPGGVPSVSRTGSSAPADGALMLINPFPNWVTSFPFSNFEELSIVEICFCLLFDSAMKIVGSIVFAKQVQ